MRIAIVLTPPSDLHFKWAAQVGVNDFVCRYPRHYGLDPIAGLTAMKERAASFGLKLNIVEGYLPLEPIALNTPACEDALREIERFIDHMGKLGVETLCYNFMLADWTRTDTRVPTRGGAMTNSYDASLVGDRTLPPEKRQDARKTFDHLVKFVKRLVPAAEHAGVKLAIHPDDPPQASLMGFEQVLFTPEGFERLFDAVPAAVNGMCFCQGTFSEMGVDVPATIRRFGKRIHYAHFRDVRGVMPRFEETFHDAGQTDMAEAIRAYHAVGFKGAMRPDHVPKLEGEDGDGGGYSMLGRLFAVGYMRGLMHAVVGKE